MIIVIMITTVITISINVITIIIGERAPGGAAAPRAAEGRGRLRQEAHGRGQGAMYY